MVLLKHNLFKKGGGGGGDMMCFVEQCLLNKKLSNAVL